MINKDELYNIEKESIESVTNKQLEKLEKKMIEDKLNSKQYCEYFIEYDEKISKIAKKQVMKNMSDELSNAGYNFKVYDNLMLIFIGDNELQEVELDAYASMVKLNKKTKQYSILLKNKVKKVINKCKDHFDKVEEKVEDKLENKEEDN
jgi:hypothetical protein